MTGPRKRILVPPTARIIRLAERRGSGRIDHRRRATDAWPWGQHDHLPLESPVRPLGIEGRLCWFRDIYGNEISVAPSEWSWGALMTLFVGRPDLLMVYWPRFSRGKRPRIVGFDKRSARACLTAACEAMGPYQPDRARSDPPDDDVGPSTT